MLLVKLWISTRGSVSTKCLQHEEYNLEYFPPDHCHPSDGIPFRWYSFGPIFVTCRRRCCLQCFSSLGPRAACSCWRGAGAGGGAGVCRAPPGPRPHPWQEDVLPSLRRRGGLLPRPLCLLRTALRAGLMLQESILLTDTINAKCDKCKIKMTQIT